MTVSMDKKYVARNGEYDAKVVAIHDVAIHDEDSFISPSYCPVVAELKHRLTGVIFKINYTFDGKYLSLRSYPPLELIEVPEASEDEQGRWIEFDAANDEVPFLHMHDMLEVKFYNEHVSTPVPAWSVNFDTLRDPVFAYRVVKKAEHPEKKSLPIEVFVDVAEAAERKVFHGEPRAHEYANTAREAAVRAVLKLAGVKV
jgi:hypothetical protein